MSKSINPEDAMIVSLAKAGTTRAVEAHRANYPALLINPENAITVSLPKAPHTDDAHPTAAEAPMIIESETIPTGRTLKLDAELHIKHLFIHEGARVVTDKDIFTTVVDGQTLPEGITYEGPLEWHNVDVSFCGDSAFFDNTAE